MSANRAAKVNKVSVMNNTGESSKWITNNGDKFVVFVDHIEDGERGFVWLVLISDILPDRYETNNRGQCSSNNRIQIPVGTKKFFISESVGNGNNFTEFKLHTESQEGNANTVEGFGDYETDEFTIDDNGFITIVQ